MSGVYPRTNRPVHYTLSAPTPHPPISSSALWWQTASGVNPSNYRAVDRGSDNVCDLSLKYFLMHKTKWNISPHRPVVVYFFQVSALFLHKGRKILAYFDQFRLFCCEFTYFLVNFYRPTLTNMQWTRKRKQYASLVAWKWLLLVYFNFPPPVKMTKIPPKVKNR